MTGLATAALVAVGAAVGAPCRWLLDRAVQARHDSVFPWGTFVVNVLGSVVLGVLLGASAFGSVPAGLMVLLATGFAGAFTTYSTFAYETVRLFEDGATQLALVNVTVSLGLGLLAALGGWYLAVAMWG